MLESPEEFRARAEVVQTEGLERLASAKVLLSAAISA
jgi:hypothetical protein